jgi:hypothetical protein
MATRHTWLAAAHRSPFVWGVAIAVLAAVVAGSVLLATSGGSPAPSPATSTRVVALGDSVPYGHGLANPYLTPRVGLPPNAVSQGPSLLAYPTLVTRDLGLTMSVRPTNCRLVGDQLAISGAVANPVDNTNRDGQCPVPPQQARNLGDELAAADLGQRPAQLVLLQDGADDINFAGCLENDLAGVAGVSVGLGTLCVQNGTVTPNLTADLSHVQSSLTSAIEQIASHARRIVVLDYYQPVPAPGQIVDDSGASGFGTNLICAGLRANASTTYAAAQIVLAALNRAIAAAVEAARAHGVTQVVLADISHAFDGHAMCTSDPWVFSGERISDAQLASDTERIVLAKSCSGSSLLHPGVSCATLTAQSDRAKQDLRDYVWRAAHPMAAGQRAIAALLRSGLTSAR